MVHIGQVKDVKQCYDHESLYRLWVSSLRPVTGIMPIDLSAPQKPNAMRALFQVLFVVMLQALSLSIFAQVSRRLTVRLKTRSSVWLSRMK